MIIIKIASLCFFFFSLLFSFPVVFSSFFFLFFSQEERFRTVLRSLRERDIDIAGVTGEGGKSMARKMINWMSPGTRSVPVCRFCVCR